jgi:endo-1,4-beta-xylanase
VAWTFQKTRQYCPMAMLKLNDYEVLENDAAMTRHLEVVDVLKAQNLIDGVALQGHFIEWQSVTNLRNRINTAASRGLPVFISEYTPNFADDTAQKNAVEAQIRLFMEHPAVQGVTFWGLNTGGWRADA